MKKSISFFLVWVQVLSNAGCATIVSGKTQDVTVRSNPSGAKVLVDVMMQGTTPLVANLIRKKRHTLEISKEGYGRDVRATTRGFNWWYLGNLILGGVIGLIVDPITGAIFDVNPDSVYVELQKAAPEEEVKKVEIKKEEVKGEVKKEKIENKENEKTKP